MKSKQVVITGGSGDIAKAIAYKLRAAGYCNVELPSRQELDVTDIQTVEKYFNGKDVDILINNAGAIFLDPIYLNNVISHKKVIDVNLIGAFVCTGAVLSHNKNAKIINIGSSAGTKVHAEWSSYCASKAALIMATKCWAEEGVDTVCISPGRTLTKMRKGMYPDEDPSTLLTPEDFAEIVFKAINGKYEIGTNIDVNISNIRGLING